MRTLDRTAGDLDLLDGTSAADRLVDDADSAKSLICVDLGRGLLGCWWNGHRLHSSDVALDDGLIGSWGRDLLLAITFGETADWR